jgi:hypothetical protein
MTEQKLDPATAWFRGKQVWAWLVAAVVATAYYVDTRNRDTEAIRVINKTVQDQGEDHKADLDRVVTAVEKVESAVKQLVTDAVARRSAEQWIENAQIRFDAWLDRLRAENPSLKAPAYVFPALGR